MALCILAMAAAAPQGPWRLDEGPEAQAKAVAAALSQRASVTGLHRPAQCSVPQHHFTHAMPPMLRVRGRVTAATAAAQPWTQMATEGKHTEAMGELWTACSHLVHPSYTSEAAGHELEHTWQATLRPSSSRRGTEQSVHLCVPGMEAGAEYPPGSHQHQQLPPGFTQLPSGYYSVRVGPGGRQGMGRRVLVHRFICTVMRGAPPQSEMEAGHLCGHPWCLNPWHLQWLARGQQQECQKWHQEHGRGAGHLWRAGAVGV